MVEKARQEDVDYMKQINLHTKAPRSKAKASGKKVVTVRWIGINKGDAVDTNYRSRLVAMEIKTDV